MSDAKTRDTGVSLTYISNNYIRSDGSTPVTGSIDMKGNTLTNVSKSVNPKDVPTKEYTDKVGGGNNNIISVHTHYYGNLIKGKYQFTFGENETIPMHSGFLIPHSGRIKKITSRIEGPFRFEIGPVFSFFLTKRRISGTRLAYFIFDYERLDEESILRSDNPWHESFYFDNDLVNYPLSDGDIINIRTERDFSQKEPKPSFFSPF